MNSKPITHLTPGLHIGHKLCQCHVCKKTAVCTPNEDFFTCDLDPKGVPQPLHCWACLLRRGNCSTTQPEPKIAGLPPGAIAV